MHGSAQSALTHTRTHGPAWTHTCLPSAVLSLLWILSHHHRAAFILCTQSKDKHGGAQILVLAAHRSDIFSPKEASDFMAFKQEVAGCVYHQAFYF